MVTDTINEKGYKQTEVGVIPEDWEIRKCGGLGSFYKGKGISSKDLVSDGLPCIMYGDIYVKFDTKFSNPDFRITKQTAANSSLAKAGDLFFTSSGETAEEIGKCVAYQGSDDIYIGGDIIAMTPNSDNDSLFLAYMLNSKILLSQKTNLGQGHTVVHIYTEHIKSLKMPIPSTKTEQTAIATVLSDTDSLIECLEKFIAKKKAIKQDTMQQLLTGKKRLPGFNGAWEVKKLGGIGETYSGLSGKTKRDFDGGKYPYIPFMNIMNNPVINLQYFDYVNIRRTEKQNKVIKGDLFFNGSSETPEEVGMCSVLQGDIPNLYLNSFCFGFRLNRNLKTDGLYLSYLFRSSFGRQLIFSLAQGATRYNLSKTNFMKLEIPYPKPAEQTAIATILSDMDAEIKKLEQRRDKYTMLKQGMMQQLLTGKIRIYANS